MNKNQLLLPIEDLISRSSHTSHTVECEDTKTKLIKLSDYQTKKNEQEDLAAIKEYLNCFRIFKEK